MLRLLTVIVALSLSCPGMFAKKPKKHAPEPVGRIFIGDSESFYASSFGAASANAANATAFHASSAGTEKWTVMAMKAVHDKCPQLTVVDRPDRADYFLRLDRNGAFVRLNAMAVFNRSGEMVYVGAGLSLQKQVKKFCATLSK